MKDLGVVGGVTGIKSTSSYFCDACAIGKSHRLNIKKSISTRSQIFLGRIHMDLIGPFRTQTPQKQEYLLTIVDDYSRYAVVYPLVKKSEAFSKFKIYKSQFESESGKKIIRIRTDRGGEFTSDEFKDYCMEHGISRESPAAYSHEQNGFIERFNRTIVERGTTLLKASGVPATYWGEAMNYATHTYNLSPHSGNNFKIPVVLFFQNSIVTPNYQPSLAQLRPFGVASYFHVPKELRRGKLGDKALLGALMGYEKGSKGFRVLLSSGAIVVGSNVVFNESYYPRLSSTTSVTTGIQPGGNGILGINDYLVEYDEIIEDGGNEADGAVIGAVGANQPLPLPPLNPLNLLLPPLDPLPPPNLGILDPVGAPPPLALPLIQAVGAVPPPPLPLPLPPPIPQPIIPIPFIPAVAPQPQPLRPPSSRIKFKPDLTLDLATRVSRTNAIRDHQANYVEIEFSLGNSPSVEIISDSTSHSAFSASTSSNDDSPSYDQSLSGPDAEGWSAARAIENATLLRMGTGILVPPIKGKKALPGRWVLTTKRDEQAAFIKRKARWVIKGYFQKYGVNFEETFASVARTDAFRAALATAASRDLEMATFDITAAFLSGDIDVEGIVVQPPLGFNPPGKEDWVWLLQKPLYGLKQAPRCWQQKLDEYLVSFGFQKSTADDCLYTFRDGDDYIFLSIHVDDGFVTSTSISLLHRFRDSLSKAFEARWIDNPTNYLGFNIRRDRILGTIRLSQQTFLSSLLDKFGMTDCNPSSTPLPINADLSPSTEEEIFAGKDLDYRSIIGGVMWLATGSRPDIAQATSALSRHCSSPSIRHYTLAKGLLRYLKGTFDYAITYSRDSTPLLDSPGVIGTSYPLVYSDADHGGDLATRRSTSAYVFIIAGGAVSWMSKLQPTVALSTTEAEYMALTEASKHAIWTRTLLDSLRINSSPLIDSATIIHGDNEASISLTKNPIDHKRLKHIDFRHHFLELESILY